MTDGHSKHEQTFFFAAACSRWVGLKGNGLGLRGLGVNIVQGDHETKLVADLAGVDSWFLPAILATSGKWASGVGRSIPCPGRWPKVRRKQEIAPLVQQAQGPLRSGGKQGLFWSSVLGARGWVIFRRISGISRLYDPLSRWHRILELMGCT